MDRRTFLRVGAGVVGVGLTGRVAGEGQNAGGERSFGPLGSVDVPGAAEAAVHHDDEIAYVAADDGFAVVDITEPDSPTVIAQRRDIDTGTEQPLRKIWDLWPWEDRLLVAGPAQRDFQSEWGFALFDISEPDNPEQLTFYRNDAGDGDAHYVHNCYFDDGIVYLTGSGIRDHHPLVMIDVSDDTPEEVGRWSILDHDEAYHDVPPAMRVIHDVCVQDGIAYLPYWDAGTWIVDVSDPGSPTVLSRVGDYDIERLRQFDNSDARIEVIASPGNSHYTAVNEDGSVLAVTREAWAIEAGGEMHGGPGGVDLYRIDDKTDPTHLASIEAPDADDQTRRGQFTTAHNCDLTGDRLYTSWYFGGVKVHDVSDPRAPAEIAWWRDPREASFWTAQSAGDVFVAASSNVAEKISDDLNETPGALYVFPSRGGTQTDSPSLTDASDTAGTEHRESDESETNESGETSETNDDGNTTEAENTTAEPVDDSADSTGPGLGVGSAVSGLGAYYLLSRVRGQRADTDDQ